MSKRVAIVGGGISGLTTAFLLKRKGLVVTLFEASATVGGNIQTIERNGYIVEQGPNSMLRSPKVIELVRLLGLESKLLPANPAAHKRYILSDGKLSALGPKAFINGYFSLKTLIGLAREPFVRSQSPAGESVAQFVSRRIGPEFLDKAIDPFVSGVYAGDAADLSMRAAFPKLYELERDFGSLIVGTLRRKKEKLDADFPRTFSFRGGLSTLINTLSAELGESIRLRERVNALATNDGSFTVNGEAFDAVVVSTPSFVAAELIDGLDRELSDVLRDVTYPQVAVVVLGFRSERIGTELDGFGFLIPSKENRPILGTLFHSAVFPERAPQGHQLLMTFVGGVRAGTALDEQTDEGLIEMVVGQLRDILKVQGGPSFSHIKRWQRAIPQYRVGYEQVTEACSDFEASNPGLYFCSNFYRGIPIGDCVRNAFATADKIEQYLRPN